MDRRVEEYRRCHGGYGDILVQMNEEDNRNGCLSQEKQIRSKDINLVPVGNSEGARIPKTLLYASS
jgi:hypothetical protein